MTTMEDFIELVAQMRQAQREYFRTRDSHVLQESKRLEKAVDKLLESSKEPNLFEP